MKYAGADWLKQQHITPSEHGENVADILGQVFLGLYHIDRQVYKVDWTELRCIEINLHSNFSTYDFNVLTRLVVLCHDRAMRLEISPCNMQFIKFRFHQRKREGSIFDRHPTIEQAIIDIREAIGLDNISAKSSFI